MCIQYLLLPQASATCVSLLLSLAHLVTVFFYPSPHHVLSRFPSHHTPGGQQIPEPLLLIFIFSTHSTLRVQFWAIQGVPNLHLTVIVDGEYIVQTSILKDRLSVAFLTPHCFSLLTVLSRVWCVMAL